MSEKLFCAERLTIFPTMSEKLKHLPPSDVGIHPTKHPSNQASKDVYASSYQYYPSLPSCARKRPSREDES